jgi:hypothetical protein
VDKAEFTVSRKRIQTWPQEWRNMLADLPREEVEVIDILEDQQHYKTRFPLVTLAGIIRESFVLLHTEKEKISTFEKVDDRILTLELEEFLDDSVVKIKNRVGSKYLAQGKVKSEHLDLYFRAASDIVRSDFEENGHGLSHFDQLKRYLVDLDYNQFRQDHRPVLEYVVKLIRKDLVDSFRKEWI